MSLTNSRCCSSIPILRIAPTSPASPPTPRETRQALLAGEQFLHGALLELALLGEELLQGFDEGIRIAQRLGDGFLFGSGGTERAMVEISRG